MLDVEPKGTHFPIFGPCLLWPIQSPISATAAAELLLLCAVSCSFDRGKEAAWSLQFVTVCWRMAEKPVKFH